MLEQDIIEPSDSEFINPLVIAFKSSGVVRVYLDARQLNNILKMDHEGTETIDEILSRCANIHFMSSFDLNMSFWQVELHENSRQYTAFLYERKCYLFKVVPFGTKVSSAVLCRGTRIAFKCLAKFLISFTDDFLCISQEFEDRIAHLELLFAACREYGITLNFKKSKIC